MKTRIMILAAMFVGALFISPVIAEDWPNGNLLPEQQFSKHIT